MNKRDIFLIILSIGIALRIIVSGIGYTFDMESYYIVAKIIESGGNVYAETSRYNYGPIWFLVLSAIYKISRFFSEEFIAFRFIVTVFLTIIDAFMFFILSKRYSLLAGLLFFLSPISIIITGYYSQFDNFALLLGFIAMIVFEKNIFAGTTLLGFSLATKHVLFAFPLWLFFRKQKLSIKMFALLAPVVIFFISFLPFLHDGTEGIIENVFLYRSFNNGPFWQAFVPDYLKRYITKEILFFGTLIIGAFLFRKKRPTDQLLFYTILLVIFSLAISEQYFAIIMPFIAIYFNLFFLLFVVVQTIFFFMVLSGGEVNWFGFFFDRSNFSFSPQVFLLFCGLLFVLYLKKFPIFHFSHLIIFLSVLNFLIYSFILFPSFLENKKMQPIQVALEKGDYELANSLYSKLEKNPPFAGSRFWYKLSNIRYSIEYYRSFRRINHKYENNQKLDKKEVEKALRHMPSNFPYKQRVREILQNTNI
ncbi:MAG: DUF2079 domain-containing protein [Patescibacteria group bacterium]|nr:DUF2079 domain-containing protein [Patescibacteria group bacterium]